MKVTVYVGKTERNLWDYTIDVNPYLEEKQIYNEVIDSVLEPGNQRKLSLLFKSNPDAPLYVWCSIDDMPKKKIAELERESGMDEACLSTSPEFDAQAKRWMKSREERVFCNREEAEQRLEKYQNLSKRYKGYPGSSGDDARFGGLGGTYTVGQERGYINRQVKHYKKILAWMDEHDTDTISVRDEYYIF